jgi:hypothetical protein
MSSVGIFVDYENLCLTLQRRERSRVNHEIVGKELLEFASRFGHIAEAVAWAEWDRFIPTNRKEQSAQAILSLLGYDCRYLIHSGDRQHTESTILKGIPLEGEEFDSLVLVTGDYDFSFLLQQLLCPTVLLGVRGALSAPEDSTQLYYFQDEISHGEGLIPIQTPNGMEPTAFYIWMQRVLQDELRRRHWKGMSFHMLARMLVERGLCQEEIDAQFHINQAVREGFLERHEADFPTGRRVLLSPTVVDRTAEISWEEDDEFLMVRLIWALELIMARNPWWEYVTFSRLREEMERWQFTSGAEETQQLVERAVEEGIYRLTMEEGGPPLYRKKYKYTFGPITPLHQPARDIPLAIIETVRSLLDENPRWSGVSFSKLLEELPQHPLIEDLLDSVDRNNLKHWCNFMVSVGALHAFRGRTRVVNGEMRDPPTLLRVIPEHPWVQYLDQSPEESSQKNKNSNSSSPEEWRGSPSQRAIQDLEFYRLVVVIEHYLHISQNDAATAGWMPMSTLFKVMGRSLDRAICNAVVRAAREREILDIRTHDPRPGQSPPRGAHLDPDHPFVTATREGVRHFLHLIQNIQDLEGFADYEAIKKEVSQTPLFGENPEERLGWFSLMRGENLITVRPVPLQPDAPDSPVQYRCSLNFRDRYVLALMEPTLHPNGEPPLSTATAKPCPQEENPHNNEPEPEEEDPHLDPLNRLGPH